MPQKFLHRAEKIPHAPLRRIFRALSIFAVVFFVSCRGSELRNILSRFAAIFCVFRAFSRFRSGFSRFLALLGI